MKITAIHDIVVPIRSAIRNAYIDFSQMTASVVAIVTDARRDGRPVVGFGFNSNGRYAPSGLLRERFIPRLQEAPADALLDGNGLIDPAKAWGAMMKNEKPGGHGERSVAVGVLDMALWDALLDGNGLIDPAKAWGFMMRNEKPGGHGERSVAVGVLDMALWDAVAKAEGVPLWRLLADRYAGGEADERAWVYAAGGYYYPGKDLEMLRREMRSYRERGYRCVKMKIGGTSLDDDLRRIEAVLEIVGEGENLAVDVNGRFELPEALAYARALAPYKLRWYEEPLDPLDYLGHAALAGEYSGPLATGENLFSMQDARNLIRHGGLRPDRDILQFDPALSYGLVEYLRILDMLQAHGWSRRRCVPHGGHQFALNIAVGLGLGGNESYPDVFAPFGGFADFCPVEDSLVRLPEIPGIGFEGKENLWAVMKPLAEAAS